MRSDNFVFSVFKISCIKWYFIFIEYYIVKYVLCILNKKLLIIFINFINYFVLFCFDYLEFYLFDSKKNNS